jgi:hypothetical protein
MIWGDSVKLNASMISVAGFLAAAALLGTAQSAVAAPLLFDFSGVFSADFVLDSSPTPDVVGPGFFQINTLSGDYQGAPVTFEHIEFYNDGVIAEAYVGAALQAVPQADGAAALFTGQPQTPTFALGTFDLTGYANYPYPPLGNETLEISSVSGVPEPSAWATMLIGLGAVGGWLRIARRKRAGEAAALVG